MYTKCYNRLINMLRNSSKKESTKDMNEQEKMIYYFLNCHKGMDDSKIRMMVEKMW